MFVSNSLKKYLTENLVPLEKRLSEEYNEAPVRQKLIWDSQVHWFKNDLGYEDLPLSHFLNKWACPGGPYKNWAVVLQTLVMVPFVERQNSTGLIVGAKKENLGGQWIPFLLDVMLKMGFTGSVSLYDTGLEAQEHSSEGLTVTQYQGYYEGSSRFTWCVDDIYIAGQPGEVKARAKYESYKAQKNEKGAITPWFHLHEGRLFLVNGVPFTPLFTWQKGHCPCDRCTFERQFPEQVQSHIRYFDGRCKPGAWEHTRNIKLALTIDKAYKVETNAALATALLIANKEGYASGQDCILPVKGSVLVEGQRLKGPIPTDVATVISADQEWTYVRDKLASNYLVDVPTTLMYLPENSYMEFEPTSLRIDDKRGYRRLNLPVSQDIKNTGTRQKDPYGRVYVGVPCLPGHMWCWLEKKVVLVPHMCPDLHGSRRKIFKGYKTSFKHPVNARDLCPKCDRSINSYFHNCVQKSVFLGITRDEALVQVKALAFDKPCKWEELPTWTDAEENLSRVKKKEFGLDLNAL